MVGMGERIPYMLKAIMEEPFTNECLSPRRRKEGPFLHHPYFLLFQKKKLLKKTKFISTVPHSTSKLVVVQYR